VHTRHMSASYLLTSITVETRMGRRSPFSLCRFPEIISIALVTRFCGMIVSIFIFDVESIKYSSLRYISVCLKSDPCSRTAETIILDIPASRKLARIFSSSCGVTTASILFTAISPFLFSPISIIHTLIITVHHGCYLII
jgi:hypothetical protein